MKKLIFLLILIFTTSVYAGQLHYQYIGLSHAQFVLAGTVISINAAKHILKLKINKIWKMKKIENSMIISNGGDNYKVGTVYDIHMNPGAEWSDPGESPIELRFNNWRHLSEVKVGEEIIIAADGQKDIIPNTPDTLAKLDFIFNQKIDPELIYIHLQDQDLYEIAIEELKKSKKINLEKLFTLKPNTQFDRDFSFNLYNRIIHAANKKEFHLNSMDFAKAAFDVYQKDKNHKKLDLIIHVLMYFNKSKEAYQYLKNQLVEKDEDTKRLVEAIQYQYEHNAK